MGNLTFFVTREYGSAPPQLWRTDGTEAGTFLLAPGGWERVVWNNRLWFISNSREIWSTDGSVAGTQKFLPSVTHPDVIPIRLMSSATHLYFTSSPNLFGIPGQLWRSDGTMSGTQPASQTLFNFTTESTFGPTWTSLGPTLFFTADGTGGGHAVWRSDAAGTSMVSIPQQPVVPYRLSTANGLVFFVTAPTSATLRVWRSDGTTGGTFPLRSSMQTDISLRSDALHYLAWGSHVYFVGDDGSGLKLWRSDGTHAGTVALASSIPGVSSVFSAASLLGFLPNGVLLFDARDSSFRLGLYAFDGNQTTFLSDLGDHPNRSSRATVTGNLLFFGAGQKLWRTDGTPAGSFNLGTFEPSFDASYNWPMAALGSELLFGARGDEFGTELWKTDGSIANTGLLKDLAFATEPSHPMNLTPVRGGVVFQAVDGLTPGTPQPKDLWFSDGTRDGTVKLRSNVLYEIGACGGRAFFSHATPQSGWELWSTDGTLAGTAMVKDLNPGSSNGIANGSFPGRFTCVDSTVFFMAHSSPHSPGELWRSDGTAAGTLMVRPLASQYLNSFSGFTAFNHQIFWGMSSDHSPTRLWRSDGTPAGTFSIRETDCNWINSQKASDFSLFISASCNGPSELWRSDGTAAGTGVFLRDDYLAPLGTFEGDLVFNWGGLSHGICRSDGTGTSCFDPGGFATSQLAVMNGRMYYLTTDGLRSSDGVSASSVGITFTEEILAVAGGRLYVRAHPTGYVTVFETDGTPDGTHPFFQHSPEEAVSSGGRLFFAADELYAYDLPVTPTSFAPRTVGEAGGEVITIQGRGFTGPASVSVGGAAASVVELTETTVRFHAPAHQTGTYKVDLTLGDGRTITLDDPLHYVCTAPVATITSASTSVCPFVPVILQGGGAANCSWFPAIGLDNPSSCTPRVSVDKTTTYTLMVTNESGCESTNYPSVTVTISPVPDATITVPATPTGTYAPNTEYTASVPDAGAGATYQWSGNIEITGANNQRTISFRTSCAVPELRVRVVNGLGCPSDSTKSLSVALYPRITSATPTLVQPGALITAGGEQLQCTEWIAFRTFGTSELQWVPTTAKSESSIQFRAPAIPPRNSRLAYTSLQGGYFEAPMLMRRAVRSDFTGDVRSDIILQNSNSGAIKQWEMGGATVLSDKVVAYLGPDWKIRALGDFDSDGKTDIVIQNSVNGQIAVWLMNGAAVKTAAIIASIGTAWRPVTAGDFNGDGKSDILLQNQTSGEIAQWQMDGVTVTAGAIIASLGTAWALRVTGDSNGDGKADIILRNQSTGAIAQWQMDGFNVAAGALLSTVGSTWDVRAAGDFNQDGLADLLLQSNSGDIALWHLNGSTVTAGALLASLGNTWNAIAASDYNGDGRSEVMLQSTAGEIAHWRLSPDGLTVAEGVLVASPGVAWVARN